MATRTRIRTVAFAIILLVVAAALGAIAAVLYGYWQGQNAYDRIGEIALPEGTVDALEGSDTSDEEGWERADLLADMAVDWDALFAINPDTVGWVYAPGTPINYPVVHSRDNDEYLYVNFNGEYGNGLQPTYGTPFLMAQNAADFSDAVNFIQAHDMDNGTMFAEIPKLGYNGTFNEHRIVYLLTPRCNYRLRSIALVECGADDAIVRTQFSDRDDFTQYVYGLLGRSIVKADPAGPTPEDAWKLVILSTCTADGTDRRSLLVCAVVEYAEPGGEVRGALGDAAADMDAASAMGEAMDAW